MTGRRGGAWLIDWLLVVGLAQVLFAAGWAIAIIYWLLRDALFEGQSIGKRVLGLRVIVTTTGRAAGFKESILRNVLWIIPIINIAMVITTLYHVLRNERHWGDRLADTRVVSASDPIWSRPAR